MSDEFVFYGSGIKKDGEEVLCRLDFMEMTSREYPLDFLHPNMDGNLMPRDYAQDYGSRKIVMTEYPDITAKFDTLFKCVMPFRPEKIQYLHSLAGRFNLRISEENQMSMPSVVLEFDPAMREKP